MLDPSCGEHPFASFEEGGSGARVQWFPQAENSSQGGMRGNVHINNQVAPGDKFRVEVSYFMARTAVGALKGTTEPIILGNIVSDVDPELYGPQTLQDFDYDNWMPLQELQLAVLFSGIATLLLRPPVIDQAVGMKIAVFDEEPEPIDMSEWQWFSEISIEFPGTEPAFFGIESPDGRDAFFFPGEQLYSWELAPGKYRVRGYSRVEGWREYAGFGHPNSVGIREYPSSGRSWDSLPSQIRLDFWPENEPHPRKDTLEQW